ncbi:hypothetical protein ZWY2020_017958 [Hordeum vulgare]|nr:hypothetical protein ZWY2020_017958 [Hordeum vulgare]
MHATTIVASGWFGSGSLALGWSGQTQPSWLADGDSGGRQTRPCERRALDAGIRLSASDTAAADTQICRWPTPTGWLAAWAALARLPLGPRRSSQCSYYPSLLPSPLGSGGLACMHASPPFHQSPRL